MLLKTRLPSIQFLLYALLIIFVKIIKAKHSADQLQCDSAFWSNIQRQTELYVDVDEKPCDDFWKYACGNWRASSQLRFAKPTDTLATIKASNKYLLLQYFEEMEKGRQINDTAKGVATFYKSCLDKRAFKSKAQDEQAIRVYTDILKNITSNWPILQRNFSVNNVDKLFNWEQVAAEMRRYGAQALMSSKIQPNWQNSQQLIFYIMPPSFELLKARQSDTKVDEESEFFYKRYIKLLMMDLGVRVRKANQIAEEIIEFEKSLMQLVNNERSVVLKEPQTLASLAAEIPDIDLLKYFNTLMQDFKLPDNYQDSLLIVADQQYLKQLSRFLTKSSAEIIAKYFLVQFLANFQVNLHEEYSFIKQKEECLMQLNDFMPSELSHLFLQLRHGNAEEFLQQTEQHLSKIFDNLKQQFEKLLNSSVVFERDPATKIVSREKLRAMKLLLPTLELSTREQFVMGDNYDVNLINLSKWKTTQQLNKTIPHMVKEVSSLKVETKLSLTSLYRDQSYGPLDINAYYRLKKNAIEIPLGILQSPLYDQCLKPAQIYGGLAYILAHEILHGFDYDGLNYDKLGNVANAWGVKAIIKFGVRSNCYLNERYDNGHVTINENIADSEGLRLALETFLESEMDESFDQEDLKLFFLSFAQTWCGNSSSDTTQIHLHASHRERVNNVLGNFMEFADVYKCRPGNNMHPEEKCRIW
ncbi:neprilysin-3 [Lucilia sericata]|uniref:neprilysin-3 n=1 Tax=Lucilia sericata TaxID=13632 RepID=UPI0018A7F930|nr:neprilysin-3 [Lucilia sericata]